MFKLEIKTGGAAFRNPFTGGEDDAAEAYEIKSLLARVALQLEHGKTSGIIMDVNGNKVGSWSR